jgi:hypothetical protein
MRRGHEERNRIAAQKHPSRYYLLIMAAESQISETLQRELKPPTCVRYSRLLAGGKLNDIQTHTAHDRLTASAGCQRRESHVFSHNQVKWEVCFLVIISR